MMINQAQERMTVERLEQVSVMAQAAIEYKGTLVISPETVLELIAEIERLQAQADALYKAARPIADKMAEDEAFGAEFDKDGVIEVGFYKDEFEKFIAVVYNWVEPVYQQKPVEEWREGRREE